MNDDFLHQLRRNPPPQFASRLRARLRSPRVRAPRSVPLLWIMACVAASAAVAAALWMKPPVLHRAGLRGSHAMTRAMVPSDTRRVHESATGGTRQAAPLDEHRATDTALPLIDRSTIAAADRLPESNDPRPASSTIESSADHVAAGAPSGRPLVRFAGPASAKPLATKVANHSLAELSFEPADSTTAIRLMCSDGPQGVDIALTTRPMTIDEFQSCGGTAGFARTGYRVAFVATELGYYGAVVTAAKTAATFRISPRQMFLALATEVPDPLDARRLIANPNRNWNQIDPGFESREIAVFGPPRESSAAMAMAELLLEAGCDEWPWIRALRTENPQRHRKICHSVREDGLYTPEQPTDYFVTQTLWSQPSALVILDYNVFDARRDQFAGSMLDGQGATAATIAAATYAAARPLYLYVPAITLRQNNFRRVFYTEYARAVRDSGYLLVPSASPMQPLQFQLLTLSPDGRGGRLSREPFQPD